MRKLLVSEMITLDGFLAGPEGDISWHNVDEEFNEFAIAQLHSVDTLIFGRVTYDLMASYWPTDAALSDDPEVANLMNATPKIVFSRALSQVDWQNTHIAQRDLERTITELKQQSGKDMVIFGSGQIVAALTDLGLIDEYRLFMNPVILGGGLPLFAGVVTPRKLQLLSSRPFHSGNVLLTYGKV